MLPDGRWLACESNASGRAEIDVQSHPVGEFAIQDRSST